MFPGHSTPNPPATQRDKVRALIQKLKLPVEEATRLYEECEASEAEQESIRHNIAENTNYNDLVETKIIKVKQTDLWQICHHSKEDGAIYTGDVIQTFCDTIDRELYVWKPNVEWYLISTDKNAIAPRMDDNAWWWTKVLASFVVPIAILLMFACEHLAKGADVSLNVVFGMMAYPAAAIFLLYIVGCIMFIVMRTDQAGLDFALHAISTIQLVIKNPPLEKEKEEVTEEEKKSQ